MKLNVTAVLAVVSVALIVTSAVVAHRGISSRNPIVGHGRNQTRKQLKILIYITTHLSDGHLAFLELCWPALLANSALYREADVAMLVTKQQGSHINMTFLNQLFRASNFRAHVRPNPGYQEGAILGMSEAQERGWFDGYDWVIRVNPDVLIRNDTSIINRMRDPNVDGIFVDCVDSDCPPGPNCTKRRVIHTDYIAFRPKAIDPHAFKQSMTQNHAETQATDVFSGIINNTRDSWITEAGPMGGVCRVRGVDSPALHVHALDDVYPACLSWNSHKESD